MNTSRGGEVTEDGSVTVIEFVGDRVEVGLVVGEGTALHGVLGGISVPLGRYSQIRPLVFSFVPRSLGKCV